ncbi:hypothetical protein BGZ63DRAFT_400796 [Mariannaea sp. PMI_226]|nr:hypothetical protein BGZ63DRAFT_400796 [Mariannaea sp. PMI_226]
MSSVALLAGQDGVPKHRACDECRSRKLACSKESDGCSRCRKEGIQCHYSPQKQMGRPRKRRHVDEEAPQSGLSGIVHHDLTTEPPNAVVPQHPMATSDFHLQPSPAVDQNFIAFQDSNSSSTEFWGLIPDDYLRLPLNTDSLLDHDNATDRTMAIPLLNPNGVDFLGSINFDEPDYSEDLSRGLGTSLQRYIAEQVSLPQGTGSSTPVDSSFGSERGTSVVSLEDFPPLPPPLSMRPVPSINCSCLSSLFLALDSLSRLPPEVIPAMRVARNASKAAHDVINCPNCSLPLLDEPSGPPPIQAFQNLMFLGTLVPSACNAYAKILEMVDAETTLAKRQGRRFLFSFKEIGGLWGYAAEEADSCSAVQNWDNSSMTPDTWRTTIRAILRFDVYGLKEDGVPRADACEQIGLRDVVRLLEERTRKRHDMIDSLVASGHVAKAIPKGIIYPSEGKQCPPEERNCVRILETARIALDNLVIA